MTAARFLDVAPLGRLVARPRAVLSWMGLATLAFGMGMMAVAARFLASGDRATDGDALQRFASVLLVVLPASAGMLMSEAAFEVLRRPTTFLLPGIGRRLRRSALVVAPPTAALFALGLAPLQQDGSRLGAFALALLGVAAGVWVMARVGGGGAWLLRVGALVGLASQAGPLCAAFASRPLLALAAVPLGLLLIALRFHPALLRSHLFSTVTTVLAPLAGGRAKASLQPAGRPELVPPPTLGRSLAGWTAAMRFERRTANPVWGPKGFLSFVAYTYVLALIGPTLITLLESSGTSFVERVQSLPAAFLAMVVGLPRGVSEVEVKGTEAFFVTIGVFAGFTASLSSAPLLGSFLYPVSRDMRARLAWALGVRVILQTAAVTLGLGAVLGGILALATGLAWPRALPAFAWIALANLLLAPWILIASHATRRAWGDRQNVAGTFVMMTVLITVLLGLGKLRNATSSLMAAHSSALWVGIYGALCAASLFAFRTYLSWSYPRRDLVRRRA